MNNTIQYSLPPLVQSHRVVLYRFLYSVYREESALVRGLNRTFIMYYSKLNIPPGSHNRYNKM